MSLLIFFLFSSTSFARGTFHYDTQLGACVDSSGNYGLNPNTLGECGDSSARNFSGRDLHGMNLRGIDLDQSSLSRANLQGADLTGARVKGADFTGANLDGAILRRTDSGWHCGEQPDGTYDCGPRMAGTSLKGADLRGFDYEWRPDFTGADLTGAILGDANNEVCLNSFPNGPTFQGARLCGASVLNVVNQGKCRPEFLRGAIFDEKTRLSFSHAEATAYGMVYRAGCR